MRIACPSCAAGYDVPDSLVTPGRVTRCARCGREWIPIEAQPEPSAEPEPPPQPEPAAAPAPSAARAEAVAPARQSAMDRLAAHSIPVGPSVVLRLAWAASVFLLVLLIVAAIVWRSDIVTAWPPSARAYAAFGLHPAPAAE